ncbi:MAG: recombinase family protein [Epsilonproteobacteria bacterium]|nr:recombinase family protein [Campylobacterota bacterium]
MNVVLLKANDLKTNIIQQQKHIFRYANQNSLQINSTEIDNSSLNEKLESKNELKGFLRSLDVNDHVLVYNLSTLSNNLEDRMKIFNCLFERSITVHITNINLKVTKNTRAIDIFSVFLKENDGFLDIKKSTIQGRPKGRMSKSKFDVYRLEIIGFLEKKYSVLKISERLSVSRSSLKDYINSRGLKDLAETRKKLLFKKDFKKQDDSASTQCNITKKDKNNNG